jgi:ribonuclease G
MKSPNREILVNVGLLESRVAMLEGGRLAELHVEREPRIVGNIYKAKVANVLPGMGAAFVDIGIGKHAFLCEEEWSLPLENIVGASREKKGEKLIDQLSVGQEILVQVNRAAVGGKGARVTTRLTLAGRYLVLLLTDPGKLGISRKIESEKSRQRLREIGSEICPPGCGLILRTESEGTRRPQIAKDVEFLMELKRRLFEKANSQPGPVLVHEDLTLVFQLIRDSFTPEVKRLWIDDPEIYKQAVELINLIAPRMKARISLYKDDVALFEKYGLEEEIGRLFQRKVWLKTGGYIGFDQAEALCAIDVNTARFTGRGKMGQADTILKTNLEAAEEIARQLRLRDIGGIIVIDFIDMETASHRAKVLKVLEDALVGDRMKTKTFAISRLGLVEMTRKKHGESLLEKVSDLCPSCGGLGRVQNPTSTGLQILRELRAKAKERPGAPLLLWAHPQVAALLAGPEGENGRKLADELKCPLFLRGKSEDPRGFEISYLEPEEEAEKAGIFLVGQQLTCHRIPGSDPSLETDVLISEEGYLVGLRALTRLKEKQVKVELLQAGLSWGVGRVVSEEIIEETGQIRQRGGITRRAFRSRQRTKPQPVKEKEISPAPVEAPKEIIKTEKPVSPEPEKPKAKSPRRRRRGGKPKETAAPIIEELAQLVESIPAPAEPVREIGEMEAAPEKKPTRRRRHHRPKKKPQANGETPAPEIPPAPAAKPAVEAPPAGEAKTDKPAKRRRRYYPRRKKTEAPPAEG